MDAQNIRLKFNENYYSEKLQNLNISDGNCAIIYEQFQDCKNVYSIIDEMYYSPKERMTHRQQVIDTTRNTENISNSKSYVIINIDVQTSVSQADNNIVYAAVTSEK